MNKKKVDKSIVYMISGITILILAIVGSAYAYYSASATGELVGSAAGGGLELTITKLSTSASGALIPLDNDVDTLSTAAKGYGNTGSTFDASKSCIDKNGYTACQVYKITLTNTSTVAITVNGGINLLSTSKNLSGMLSHPNIDCAKMDDSITVTNNSSCQGSKTLANNYTLNAGSNNDYYVIIYIKNLDVDQYDSGDFNGIIYFATSDGKELYAKFADTAAERIANLFNPSVTSINNNIKYDVDDVNYLMEDIAGNIRYYGASPNNYIYFNCDTYPETNCELWRIIGVFDGKLKITRANSIGSYSWDTSSSDVNNGGGINEWSQADLMKLLNPGYEKNNDLDSEGNTITVNNSLYWNAESGICYNGKSNATTECDFTGTGIKNDTTRNMIAEVIWNLGGYESFSVYLNQIYGYERGTNVESNPSDGITRTTSWTGKIGLVYPSDYGYAGELSKCDSVLLRFASGSAACIRSSWMFDGSAWWFLTSSSLSGTSVSSARSLGGVTYQASFNQYVVPALYLSSQIDIISGTGSKDNPYRLG